MTTTIADEVKEAMESTTKTTEVEKKLEIIIDDSTGLPLLPDGMFWRVAEYETKEYPRYSLSTVTRKRTGVQLISTKAVEKTREIPVFGTRWYNKNIVVEHKKETYHELEEKVLAQREFDGHGLVYGDDKAPALAVNIRTDHDSLYFDRLYDIPISDAGVAYLAAEIYENFYENSRNEAYDTNAALDELVRKKLEDTDKARLLGDYPPKTLIPA